MENWISNLLSSNNLTTSLLNIEDLNELEITKIKYDKLYFKYKNTRYFIIAYSDCGDRWFTIYKKDLIGDNWRITKIKDSGWVLANIKYLLDDKSRRKRNIVYKHIDKEYFVKQLRENNLIYK